MNPDRSISSSNPPRCDRCLPRMSLMEMLIILVMLASVTAVVVPHFSNATVQTPQSVLKDELRYLRTQIAFFKAQHRNVPPGYPAGDAGGKPDAALFLKQMTSSSDDGCNTSPAPSAIFKLGPYLTQMPVDPLTGQGGLLVVTGTTMPPADESQPYGWIYNPTTLQLIANLAGSDPDGTRYTEY